MTHIPVITIDGPSGSGKGTISHILALELGWHYLDSGALYRVLAYMALSKHLDLTDEVSLSQLAAMLPVQFVESEQSFRIFWKEKDITEAIRTEACSQAASKVAAFPLVRDALMDRQRAFRQAPGLVTDGRDMGTVIFPDADVKIFLEASAEERAQRRYSQLQKLGFDAKITAILAEIEQRDARDRTREVAPLIPAQDAIVVDTSGLTIHEVVQRLDQIVPKNFFGRKTNN